jgi:hypothetical protein
VSTPLAGGKRLFGVRALALERLDLAFGCIFILLAAFFVWTAATTVPLSLHGGLGDRYNLLASAFLHFRLSIGAAPASILRLAEPYSQKLNGSLVGGINDASRINDDAMYHGQLYFVYGAAPALVLLVPLHLLGFEPSASVTVSVFAVAGLGFALGALKVVIRQLGDDLPMWMCILAGLAVSLSSAVPFLLRTPSISEDTLAGGYCFMMAGVWLAGSALAGHRASGTRLVLMSLCFGLAANSRPTLALGALVLIPVYLSLRPGRSRRSLLTCLALPVCVCFILLLAYNQARFHDPLEVGTHYQLTGYNARTAPLGRLSYALPGFGLYAFTPPRLTILFPFIRLVVPQAATPAGLAEPEITGGLVPLAPIVVFLVALPWVWRRRPRALGPLAVALLILAAAGIAMVLLSAYEFFSSTERYEVDFATLLVLGGVATWLALSSHTTGYRRRLLRVGGGLLAAWGCAAGFAITFFGYGASFAETHPATWRTLEDIGSPLSTAIAIAVGHPVLAAVSISRIGDPATVSSVRVDKGVPAFSLSLIEQGQVTIVSPDARRAMLTASITPLEPGGRYRVRVEGPGHASYDYALPMGEGLMEVPVTLHHGLNRLTLSPVGPANLTIVGQPIMLVSELSIAPTAVRALFRFDRDA